MSTLRRFLCWYFGAHALGALVAAPLLLVNAHPFRPVQTPGFLPVVLVRLAVTMPSFMGVFCGMAWWTLRQRKSAGRLWAIAASLGQLVLGLLLVYPDYLVANQNSRHKMPLELFVIDAVFGGFFLFTGIAGLIAFSPRNAVEQMPKAPPKPPRIPGDGTSGALDVLTWILELAGYIAGMRWWAHWSHSQGLPTVRAGLIQIGLALALTILLHECGHAFTGRALGMRLRGFVVGPFQWRIRSGRWTFKFLPTQLFAAGGATMLVPGDPHYSARKQVYMIAAGPLTNLITGLIAMFVAMMPETSPQVRSFLALLSTISVVTFAGNLVPFRHQTYSDGARIFQILAGGPLADCDHLASVATSSLVTPLRPRDFDIDALQRTARVITTGTHGLMLRLGSYEHFLDRGELGKASAALMEAESFLQQSHMELPTELHTVFVFGNAFLRRDAAAARQWWERMEAKKPTHFNVDYWRAKSALHWIEGDLEEANAAWKKCDELAERLPEFGAYESDRASCALLREAMDIQPQPNPTYAAGKPTA